MFCKVADRWFSGRLLLQVDVSCSGCRKRPINLSREHMKLKQIVNDLVHDESGQDLIEYALVAALIGLGAVASMKTLATAVGTTFTTIGTTLTSSV